MKPLISIIIPVYNVAPYLRECLDSVLSQTFGQWECICLDDGSTDESGKILDAYAQTDGRFRVVHRANAGVSAARNAAMQIAKGDYVTFVDADDFILLHWLENAARTIDENPVDVVRMELAEWVEGSPLPPDQCSCKNKASIGSGDIVDWVMTHVFRRSYPVLLFVRRSVLENGMVRFPVGMTMCEDTVFLLQLLPHIKTLVQIDYAGYIYRVRRDSVCHATRRLEQVEQIIEGYNKLISDDLAGKYATTITQEVMETFSQWLWSNNAEERKRDSHLCQELTKAVRKGMFVHAGVAKFYWPGFMGFRMLKSLKPFYFNCWLLKIYVRRRGKRL